MAASETLRPLAPVECAAIFETRALKGALLRMRAE
jgi:hypothetical protein